MGHMPVSRGLPCAVPQLCWVHSPASSLGVGLDNKLVRNLRDMRAAPLPMPHSVHCSLHALHQLSPVPTLWLKFWKSMGVLSPLSPVVPRGSQPYAAEGASPL